MNNVFIIADIGSNHRNDYELAVKNIYKAHEAGCDAVKFQFFYHKDLYGFDGELEFQFKEEWFWPLSQVCRNIGIEFMCTGFSAEGIKTIDPFVQRHKISSCEFQDKAIWGECFKANKPIIFSTGGFSREEIRKELTYSIPLGYAHTLTMLECAVHYPARISDYRLSNFDLFPNFGLSDHTMTIDLALMAVDLGASVIEHHFDGVNSTKTPDSPVSFLQSEMTEYVKEIRTRSDKEISPYRRKETKYGFFREKI